MEDDTTGVTAPEPRAEASADGTPARPIGESARLAEAFQISPSFLCLLSGPDHVFEMANDAYHRLVGDRDLIGRPLREALPEVVEQGFIVLLDQVLQTGDPFHGREVPVRLSRTAGGPLEERFVDFVYQALSDETDQRTGILVHGYDVTDQVVARREVERLLADSRLVQEQLEDANVVLEEQQAEIETTNQQLQENAVELEEKAQELELTTVELADRVTQAEGASRRARFVGDVGMAITGGGSLRDMMQRCCQSAVDHIDAAFARVWVLDPAEQMLVLTASAGLYTHLDGPHGRVPMGKFKIGQIAADRRPHLTNSVLGDPRVPEQDWARREGLVAFAGYPLVVSNDTVGVMAMFAKRELTHDDFDALGSAATAVSVTISRARHLEGEQRARRAAEEASRAKAEFLATMSHELRTPLNAIGGYAELLELGLRGPVTAEQRADLARIQLSQQHLLDLISQILDLAKDDAGALRVDRAPIRTGDTVDAALSLVRPQAASKELVISDACGGSTETQYVGDEPRVRQVLVNLLGNAVKFTPAGGRITVSCSITESIPSQALLSEGVPYVALRVVDTGVGIPADQMGRIFEPFTQVERNASTYARPAGGTGLGLAISRRLARLMGGDLTVDSCAGEGSTFTLWLPAVERRARTRQPAAAASDQSAAGSESLASMRGSSVSGAGASAVQPTAGAGADARRPSQRDSVGSPSQRSDLARFGEAFVAEVIPLLHVWARRLREDEAIPDARRLTDAELEGHSASFLTDIALALRILDGTTGDSSTSMRDGTAIMNLIGERHGAQRARLGWPESALIRERALLAEELDVAIGRIGENFSPATVEQARNVIARLLEQATRVSIGGYRLEELGTRASRSSGIRDRTSST